MYDLIIIGAGPAGISAGLYAKRANLDVLILYKGNSNLDKAEKIDNYYGFPGGINGKDLYYNGIEQAIKLGVDVKEEEVINISKNVEDNFEISTNSDAYVGRACIIATGNKKLKPNIKGINELEGKGISYCAICDGFFYRNKRVVVIGNGKYAIHEANDLKNTAKEITILTDGEDMAVDTDYEVVNKKIKEIIGEDRVSGVTFEDGTSMEVDGVFIALGEAGAGDFAKKLGVVLEKDSIVVNEKMETNVKGLYSCGDSTGGLLQVCKAVYEGAEAGLSVVSYIRGK